MNFLIVLVCVIALAAALRTVIKNHPVVFYVLCIVLDVLMIVRLTIGLPPIFRAPMSILMQRGGLGMAFFVLVMFIGVLPRKSLPSRWFRPIRAELSIMASILILGHITAYLFTYVPALSSGASVSPNVRVSFAIASLLLVLLLMLGGTSFRFVKRRMKAHNWKKIQRFAYLFYGLVYLHLMIILLPSAIQGADLAMSNVVMYTILFGSYLVLRIVRAYADKKEKVEIAQTVIDQGFVEV